MKISVLGCGYLGAVHAAGIARRRHDVVAIDIDEERIAKLAAGEQPFFEPDFPELLESGLASGRLKFTTDFSAVHGARVQFIWVGTPHLDDGYAADVSQVDAAIEAIIPHITKHVRSEERRV